MALKLFPSYKSSWPGVLRIGFWCLFFLLAFGRLVPDMPEQIPLTATSKNSPVTPLLTIPDDNRTIRDDFKTDPQKINIAWLADSSGVLLQQSQDFKTAPPEEFHILAQRVSGLLEQQHKMKNFSVPLYLRLGMRPVDALVFSLHALKSKPGLIVLPINSVSSFSHYQVANRFSSMHFAPSIFASYPRLWPMLFAFCSPAQDLWALIGKRLDILRYASPFKGYLQTKFGSRAQEIAARPPRVFTPFWIVRSMLKGDKTFLMGDTGGSQMKLFYNQVLQHNSPDDVSWATDAFHDLLDLLRASGVPVLIYNWPMSEYFDKDPKTLAGIRKIQDFLEKENAGLKGSNIKIISKVPDDVRRTITFRADGYHATDPGKMDDFLAREIWLMLKDKQGKK